MPEKLFADLSADLILDLFAYLQSNTPELQQNDVQSTIDAE
jgi:hypothetical protein